jgi:hypothetical protein
MPSETSTLMLSTRIFSASYAPTWNTLPVQSAMGVAKTSRIQSRGIPNG